jgi:hypothetical protein
VHLRIVIDAGDNPSGLRGERIARCMDEIAADVHQSAPAALDLIADVLRIHVVVAEEAHDGTERSDAPFGEQFSKTQPLRITANHKGLADLHSCAGADSSQGFRLGNGEAERLLAENVFAGLRGLDGPWHVQLVGKGIVDGVDIGIGQKLFVRAVSRGDVK